MGPFAIIRVDVALIRVDVALIRERLPTVVDYL
jgi:hypothetical protein